MQKNLILDALHRHNSTGRVPLGSPTSIACQDLMQLTDAWFPQAHLDAEAMARLAIAGHTVLGLDNVMPLYGVCHEVGALGCNVDWGSPDAMPDSCKPIWQTSDDIRVPADFLTRPACKVPLDALGLLRKRLNGSAAVCGKVFGPWTLAYHLFGVENFLIGTMDNPDETRRILERLAPVTIAFAKAQVEAGADMITLADHATRDLCSPGAYEEFLLPMHTRLAAEIPAPVALHICGNTSDRIAMIAKTGLACFHWDTRSGRPEEVRKLAGDRLALVGGVNNYLLLKGTPEQVTEQVSDAAKNGIDIIGPECAIPLKTPLANLMAIAASRGN